MNTPRQLDHIVLAVRDLDREAAALEALGFTLTPRAMHEDRMGTSNRLAQFTDANFIELLEVDRPGTLDDHAFDESPPRFSFGAHIREFLNAREGMSMLVFRGEDSALDCADFAAAGLPSYAPFDFQRQAKLPDGKEVTVEFSLAFTTAPALPEVAFFTCHNRYPDLFWKSHFQAHANGATGIRHIYVIVDAPTTHAGYFATLVGSTPRLDAEEATIPCARGHQIVLMTPARASEQLGTSVDDAFRGFLGIGIHATNPPDEISDIAGMAIKWLK
ncbi:MAG: VOC family protein [Pseudomonadota bacterium]